MQEYNRERERERERGREREIKKNKFMEPFSSALSVIAVAVSCGGMWRNLNPLYGYFSLKVIKQIRIHPIQRCKHN